MISLQDFDRLCTQIFFYNNKFQFPFDAIKHEEDFQDLLNSKDYPILESKMKNLIELINKDSNKINEDTKDLWDLI